MINSTYSPTPLTRLECGTESPKPLILFDLSSHQAPFKATSGLPDTPVDTALKKTEQRKNTSPFGPSQGFRVVGQESREDQIYISQYHRLTYSEHSQNIPQQQDKFCSMVTSLTFHSHIDKIHDWSSVGLGDEDPRKTSQSLQTTDSMCQHFRKHKNLAKAAAAIGLE